MFDNKKELEMFSKLLEISCIVSRQNFASCMFCGGIFMIRQQKWNPQKIIIPKNILISAKIYSIIEIMWMTPKTWVTQETVSIFVNRKL